MEEIAKKYGENTIMTASDLKDERISTGLFSVDYLIGGGWPRGRWSMVYGPRGGGKTTFLLKTVGSLQKEGGSVLFIDYERGQTTEWMKIQGVDTDELLWCKPSTCEEGLSILMEAIDSRLVDLVIIDSVTGMLTRAERDRSIDDESIALQARKLSQFLRMYTDRLDKSGIPVIFTSQVRTDINTYGAPEGPTSGQALLHYASIIMKVRRSNYSERKERDRGYLFTVSMAIKSKICTFSNEEIKIDFSYTGGINESHDLFLYGLKTGIIGNPASGTYEIGETKVRGVNAAIRYIEENPDVKDWIQSPDTNK